MKLGNNDDLAISAFNLLPYIVCWVNIGVLPPEETTEEVKGGEAGGVITRWYACVILSRTQTGVSWQLGANPLSGGLYDNNFEAAANNISQSGSYLDTCQL